EPELGGVIEDTGRLAGELEREGDLIDAYREVAPNVLDAEIQRRLYLDIADLARAVRKDMALARDYYQKVLDGQPDDRRALAALESIYRETNDDERLGEIHEKQLRDFETAIDNFSAALSGDQRNQVALAAVERYLVDPDLRVVAAEVLEPIYVAQHRWHDLIRVYEARLESAGDPRERLKLTRFVARLYEDHLEDFDNACKWYAKVFRESPSDDTIR